MRQNETKSKPRTTPEKNHFLLACVELTFMDQDNETGITRVNTMTKSPDGRINIQLLGKTQQAAQIQLMQKLNDPNIQFLNAVFLGFSDLGLFTDEEFNKGAEHISAPQPTPIQDLN